jgi:hypothetical protein
VPVVTCTVFPWIGGPVTTGCAVDSSNGRLEATGPTRLAKALAEPVLSTAVTLNPSVFPTSRSPSAKVGDVAPLTERHAAPAALQRYHWNLYVVGPEPAQLPERPVRSFPAAAVPITVGPVEATGPRAEAPEVAANASSSSAAAETAARRLARRATSQGYGSGGRQPHGIRRGVQNPNRRALEPGARERPPPRELPTLDGLMRDTERAERQRGAAWMVTRPKHVFSLVVPRLDPREGAPGSLEQTVVYPLGPEPNRAESPCKRGVRPFPVFLLLPTAVAGAVVGAAETADARSALPEATGARANEFPHGATISCVPRPCERVWSG